MEKKLDGKKIIALMKEIVKRALEKMIEKILKRKLLGFEFIFSDTFQSLAREGIV